MSWFIDPYLCTRYYAYFSMCPHRAISFDAENAVKPVPYYTSIIKRLGEVPNTTIIDTQRRVLGAVLRGSP